tara:strand:- start:12777 stop:13274 length:498 start_codon:yes stop_codon:yes gene_type:complete
MYYFDNTYLLQYLLSGVSELKVFADGEYYIISSADDLLDPDIGHGYDIYGEHDTFDYKMIDHIIVNGQPFTINQLQDSMAPDSSEDSKKPESDATDEKDAKKDKKEESIQLGDYVKNNDPKHTHFGTKGSVVLSENGYVMYRYFDAASSTNFNTIQVEAGQVIKC